VIAVEALHDRAPHGGPLELRLERRHLCRIDVAIAIQVERRRQEWCKVDHRELSVMVCVELAEQAVTQPRGGVRQVDVAVSVGVGVLREGREGQERRPHHRELLRAQLAVVIAVEALHDRAPRRRLLEPRLQYCDHRW